MSVLTGSAASNSTEPRKPPPPLATRPAQRRPRSNYLRELAVRREAMEIRQQSAYGLIVGWIVMLVAGFLYFCVPSHLDLLWAALIGIGLIHLALAVAMPQALAWPQRVWMAIARWQGWLVMAVLLTIVYFILIWPASFFAKRRVTGFAAWTSSPPSSPTAWEPIQWEEQEIAVSTTTKSRSLPLLFASVVGVFFRRGDYIVLPILVLLLVIGLVLYFVQSSALAPFIYTIF